MRISVSSDMDEPVARALVAQLRERGHEVLTHGALRPGDDPQWAVCSGAAARDVADGRSDQAVVCCWTGTGASIAANKVPGVRAALCTDAYTADGARRWNDANVLALGLRLTSGPLLTEILDAWFAAEASQDTDDRGNVAYVDRLDTDRLDTDRRDTDRRDRDRRDTGHRDPERPDPERSDTERRDTGRTAPQDM